MVCWTLASKLSSFNTMGTDNDSLWPKIAFISLPINLNRCFGAQKNRLIETVLLSTHNICFGWVILKTFSSTHSYLEACNKYIHINVTLNHILVAAEPFTCINSLSLGKLCMLLVICWFLTHLSRKARMVGSSRRPTFLKIFSETAWLIKASAIGR